MDVSIGLPNTVPGTSGEQLVEWAKRAEGRGFTSLGTIDRLVYQNFEPLTALTAAAAVTERIGLVTNVLLGPLRANAAVLAKQALSVHALSGERLTLGIGLGGRDDDFEFAGIPLGHRGEELDAMLARMKEAWASEEMGPRTDSPPTLVVGGAVDASFERAAKFGDGWIAGGASSEEFAGMAAKARDAWATAGRDGEPRLMGLAYFSLGDDAEADANGYLTDYYAWLGAEVAGYIAGSAAKDGETVKGYLAGFERAGCDELILCPCASDPGQVDLLADAAGL
ncbi:MAG: LLM class flavin-dependent oxidoreductase [Solirubrobacterales bacterium]|nr:LLM class flavin-dependent oxidoreductase [Solirubrobacterales bacterium]